MEVVEEDVRREDTDYQSVRRDQKDATILIVFAGPEHNIPGRFITRMQE
jgi:hypothetical protein